MAAGTERESLNRQWSFYCSGGAVVQSFLNFVTNHESEKYCVLNVIYNVPTGISKTKAEHLVIFENTL